MSQPPRSLKDIFLGALDAAPAERAAFLDDACAGDSALRRQVEDLLRVYDEPDGLLDRPRIDLGLPASAAASFCPPPDQPVAEAPGTLIGPYKLLERIGEGGMGEVWMAEQREPMQRKIALKIIKEGMETRQVVARFEAERQALALMDHPNIAKVFDAGATDSGRPYFVMELVKGTPITTYCDEHRLTLRQRLELFLPVCRAIQHAHQKGVIHRDIKPSNVLIAPYDGRPVPKIIDFGVAKADGRRLTERTLDTGFGVVVGTLEYMSPEQAELNNQDIDTRSDIYSLGVLLYELLTGTTPIRHERLTQAAFTEMLRAIREEEPPRPSTRLSDSKETLPLIAAQRQSEPARLTRMLHRDLDWIVMKTLEKDRNRRYETASDLVRDIEHFLNKEPVEARPPSLFDRLTKWSRRNRQAVWASAAILVATLVLLALALVGNAHIGRALTARDQARIELKDQQTLTLAAERDKTWERALSHWKEAWIARAARQPGQRYRSLEALSATVQELRSLGQLEANRDELRDDALASLTLWDVRAVGHLPATPGLATPRVDPLGQYYAFAEAPSVVCWQRLADRQVIHRWQWVGLPCRFLDVSPDGRHVYAFCSDARRDQECRVWDSVTGRVVLHHPCSGWEHAFRPDGKVLALVQADGSVALCELGTGRDLSSLPAGRMPQCLRYHPGGRYLAISSHAHNDAEVWDVAARNVVLRLPGVRYAGAALAWSPDGSILALGNNDHSIYLCSFPGGKVQAVLSGHEHVITRVVCHPSGRLVASTSHDDTTRLWSFAPPGGEVVLPGQVLHDFTRDGRRLTTSSSEGVTQWEVVDPRGCVHYLPHGEVPTGGGWGVAFGPDSRLLASASPDGVLLWDAATARPIGRVPSGGGHFLAFSPGGRDLLTTGPGGLMRWPIVREREGRALRVGPGTVLHATTVDGRALRIDVASRGGLLLLGAEEGGVDIIPLAAPERARRLGTHDGLFAVAISPDGHWAVSAAGNPYEDFCIWDVVNSVRVRRFPSGGDHPVATFSPDGRTLLTGVRTRFSFWDVGSWELKASLPRAPRSLEGLVAFTRDGGLLALSQGRHQIQLHDAATLRRLATLETPAGPANLVGLSLSPDGTRLAATTDYNVVVLWDLLRLRQELAALDLDWEMPPYPPSGHAAEPVEALTAEILPAAKSPR